MARKRRPPGGYREKILQTASRLMIEHGVAQTSLADIARDVGISKGTLFYYYPSKAELIFDISERHIQRITERIFAWIEAGGNSKEPAEVLQTVFRAILESESRGHIHVYLIQEALTGDPALRRRFVDEYQRWALLIEEGLTRVVGRPDNYAAMAWIILAALDGFLLQHLLGVDEIPLTDVSRYLLSMAPITPSS